MLIVHRTYFVRRNMLTTERPGRHPLFRHFGYARRHLTKPPPASIGGLAGSHRPGMAGRREEAVTSPPRRVRIGLWSIGFFRDVGIHFSEESDAETRSWTAASRPVGRTAIR